MSDGKKTDVPGTPLDDSLPTETPRRLQQDLGLDRRAPRPVPSFDQLNNRPPPPVPTPAVPVPNLKHTSPYSPTPAKLREASGEHPVPPEYANTVISDRKPPSNPIDFAKTQPSAVNPVLAKMQAEERAIRERELAQRQLAERDAAEKAANQRLVAERLATGPRVPALPPHLRDPSLLVTDPERGVPPPQQRPQALRQQLASRPLPVPVAAPPVAATARGSEVTTDPMPREAVPPAATVSAPTVVQRMPAPSAAQVPKTDPMQTPDVLAAISRSAPPAPLASRVAIPPPAPLAMKAPAAPTSRPLPLAPAPAERTEVSRPLPIVTAPPARAPAPPPGVPMPPSAARTEISRPPIAAAPAEPARADVARPLGAAAPADPFRADVARPLGAAAPTEATRVDAPRPLGAAAPTEATRVDAPRPLGVVPLAAAEAARTEVARPLGVVPIAPVTAAARPQISSTTAVQLPRMTEAAPTVRAPSSPAPVIDAAPAARSAQGPQVTPTPARQVSPQDLTPVPPKEAPSMTAPAPPPRREQVVPPSLMDLPPVADKPRREQVVPPSFMDLPPAMEKPRRMGPDLATTQPGVPGPYSKGRAPSATPAHVPKATPPDRPARSDTRLDQTLSPEEAESDQVLASPASLWRRAFSWILDLAVISGLAGGMLLIAVTVSGSKPVPNNLHGIDVFFFRLHPIAIPSLILTVLLAVLYTTLGAFLLNGRTLGRLLFGIRLVDSSGKAPGVIRSLFRALFAILSFALFLAGFWLALFDRRGQTLHDKLTRTFVIRPV